MFGLAPLLNSFINGPMTEIDLTAGHFKVSLDASTENRFITAWKVARSPYLMKNRKKQKKNFVAILRSFIKYVSFPRAGNAIETMFLISLHMHAVHSCNLDLCSGRSFNRK